MVATRVEVDAWTARLARLASLARVDGLLVVLPPADRPKTYAMHNLLPEILAEPRAAKAVGEAIALRSTGRADGMNITLADGRTAASLVVAPVIWREQLVGALVAASAATPGDADVRALGACAELVALDLADSTAAYRAQRQVADLDARLRSARELQRVAREGDVIALLERARDQIAEQFGADGISIMLAQDDGRLAIRSARGLSDEARRATPAIGEGISGGVARSRQPALLVGPVAGGTDPTASEAMIAPLIAGDHLVGVVNVKHRGAEKRYTQAHLDALIALGQELASAYLAALELSRASADRQQAIVLYELSRFAMLGTEPRTDLSDAAAMLAGTLGHDSVTVWQHENERLRLRAVSGWDLDPDTELALDESDTTLATVLREKRTARQTIGVAEDRPEWAARGSTQFVLAPIGALGVVVFARQTEPYADAERDFSATVAEYLAGMLQKSSAQDVVDRGVATERRRIAQEIHDGLAQELTGVVLSLEGCQRAFEKDPNLLGPQLAKAARDARATLADVRQYMAALRQSEMGALNLPVTLGRLVDDLRRQTGLAVEMEENGPQRELEPIVERAVIRIVGEALRNVAQHAEAKKAKVTLQYGSEGIVATIEDDGKGFDVEHTFADAVGRGHFGAVGMKERAEAAGGQLVIRSETGRGTIVRASIPYMSMASVPSATEPATVGDEAAAEEPETVRGGFLARLFGR